MPVERKDRMTKLGDRRDDAFDHPLDAAVARRSGQDRDDWSMSPEATSRWITVSWRSRAVRCRSSARSSASWHAAVLLGLDASAYVTDEPEVRCVPSVGDLLNDRFDIDDPAIVSRWSCLYGGSLDVSQQQESQARRAFTQIREPSPPQPHERSRLTR